MTPIPKRIIQTARSAELPLMGQASAVNIKLLHPDFEYRFFDNAAVDAFMAGQPQAWREAFHEFPHTIQRYDFFRYVAVFRLGGFYFDTDVFLARSLQPLLASECVFPFEELTLMRFLRASCDIDWELGNYAFGARPEHPFLEAVIENCVKGLKDHVWRDQIMAGVPGPFRGQFEATNSTGPGMVTRTFAENKALQPGLTILFPKDVCDRQNWHRFGDYGVHLMAGTWRNRDGFVKSRLTRLWVSWTRQRLLRESSRLGAARQQGAMAPLMASAPIHS